MECECATEQPKERKKKQNAFFQPTSPDCHIIFKTFIISPEQKLFCTRLSSQTLSLGKPTEGASILISWARRNPGWTMCVPLHVVGGSSPLHRKVHALHFNGRQLNNASQLYIR